MSTTSDDKPMCEDCGEPATYGGRHCFGCKARSISFDSSAAPGRMTEAAEINAREKRWEGEHRAYRELVANGVQPPSVASAPEIARRATSTEHAKVLSEL